MMLAVPIPTFNNQAYDDLNLLNSFKPEKITARYDSLSDSKQPIEHHKKTNPKKVNMKEQVDEANNKKQVSKEVRLKTHVVGIHILSFKLCTTTITHVHNASLSLC